ncbi:MAG TPA: fused MFS/spermidine synthase [Polyangiales bacterium]|nr:fused MFS/spermidine synthase [Polyangiales bacterium]
MTSSRTSRRFSQLLVVFALWVWSAPGRGAEQTPPDCGTENLLAGKLPYQQFQIRGDASLLTDGAIAVDSTAWDNPAAITLDTRAGSITYDLGRPYAVGALYMQGDANDTYRVSGSLDGSVGSWKALAEMPNVVQLGHGLRGRTLQVAPETVRYLRIGEAEGDGYFSISEFAAYCTAPTPFPPAMRVVAGIPPAAPDAPGLAATPHRVKFGPLDALLALGIMALGFVGLRGGRLQLAAAAPSEPAASNPERYFPLVFLLFVTSGCAALIYEIVWFQLLQLVLGSSAVSIGVLLGTFMAGMCIGSLLLSRFVERSRHPLQVYAFLELAIGVCGIGMLFAVPLVQSVYTSVVGHGVSALLLRGILAALCLLPPTVMMGATLPAVARWVRTTPRGVSWLGYFYGANTLGAVLGCLLAGFYLLRVHDMPFATYVAVALNLLVAVAALAIVRAEPAVGPELGSEGAKPSALPPGAAVVYLTIGLSGMTALAAEVVWTRLFTLLLSGSTYTFSIILAVFLVGIGLGSGAGSFLARRSSSPRLALGLVQLGLVGAMAWTAWNITSSLPHWPINPMIARSPWYQFQLDLVRCVWAILPAACLWGASFPLALASVATDEQDGAVLVGRIYAANTVGAILGALLTSLLLIGWLGTQNTQRVLIGLAGISALAVLVPLARQKRALLQAAFAVLVVVELAGLAARSVAPVPTELVGLGRISALGFAPNTEVLYVGEGMNSSLMISRNVNGVLSYHNAGKVQASSLPQDMRLQRMLGHLTTLLIDKPKDVLVIACGAGVTAGAASIDPRVEKLTIAEIEPLVPKAAGKYFGGPNFDVIKNPKVRVEVDDARHFLTTTSEKFDAITSDPFDPWVKGAANLYTREFWELTKRHLKPGGVVTVFVQLYDSGMPAVKSEIATFFEAFPNALIWGNTVQGEGYDIVLSGQVGPARIDVDALERRLASPEYAEIVKSLRSIGFDSAMGLLSTFGGRRRELEGWLADAEINRDSNLRLQFLAGFGMNRDQRAEIYRGILSYRRYPEDLFVGPSERVAALRSAILSRAY